MTLQGTFLKGAIILDQPPPLPDGVRVEVTVKEQTNPEAEQKPTLLSLLKLAGTAKDLPEDFAAQHDHYIHGTPKQ